MWRLRHFTLPGGHAHLKEGGPGETGRPQEMGGSKVGVGVQGCSGLSLRQLELEVARGLGVPLLLQHPSLAPPVRSWGWAWRCQLPPFCLSRQDLTIERKKQR